MLTKGSQRLRGQTFEDFYRALRESDFGPHLPAFDQINRPALLDEPLVRNAPYLLYVANFADQTLPYVSDNAAAILGHSAAWIREGGLPRLFSLINPADEALSTQIGFDYIRVREERIPRERLSEHYWTIATRVRHADGHLIWFLVQYLPLYFTETGRVLFALGMGHDATPYYRFSEPAGSVVYPDAKGHRITVTLPIRPQPLDDLTSRELEVLALVVKGLTSLQIADQLSISKTTVDTHRRNILSKTGSSNTVELTHLALSLGLV